MIHFRHCECVNAYFLWPIWLACIFQSTKLMWKWCIIDWMQSLSGVHLSLLWHHSPLALHSVHAQRRDSNKLTRWGRREATGGSWDHSGSCENAIWAAAAAAVMRWCFGAVCMQLSGLKEMCNSSGSSCSTLSLPSNIVLKRVTNVGI